MNTIFSVTRFMCFKLPPAITYTVVYALFLVVSLFRQDPDFGWHLRSGEVFFHEGIPATDIFTYTATNFPWVNHEWLSDIVQYVVHSSFSFTGLAVLYAALWTLAIWLVTRASYPVVAFLATIAVLPLSGVRAITWTVVFLAILVVMLSLKNKRIRLLIPLLFLLWANMHGSFLVGLAYGGMILIKERDWRLIPIGVVSALMTFLTPYGHHLYTEVFRTMFDSELTWQILEWHPGVFPEVFPFVVVWGALGYYAYRTKGISHLPYIGGVFAAWAMSTIRMWPLYIIVAAPFVQTELRRALRAAARHTGRQLKRTISVLSMLVAIVCTGVAISTVYKAATESIPKPAAQIITRINNGGCTGNLFHEYGYGGELIYRAPDTPVYIDGRMPSWRDENDEKYLNTYNTIRGVSDKELIRREFDTHNITCVLIEHSPTDPLRTYLLDNGWSEQIVEESSAFYVKDES